MKAIELTAKQKQLFDQLTRFNLEFSKLSIAWDEADAEKPSEMYDEINQASSDNYPFDLRDEIVDVMQKSIDWQKAIYASVPERTLRHYHDNKHLMYPLPMTEE